jgi:tRNA(Ile)-lysidine synthase
VSGAVYRPRAAALEGLLDRVLAGSGGTLHGAQVSVGRDSLRIFREFNAVRDTQGTAGEGPPWDGMWQIAGPAVDGLTVRALGADGLAQIPEKPGPDIPCELGRSLPAVFEGDRLVACGPLDHGPPPTVTLIRPAGSFVAFLQLR